MKVLYRWQNYRYFPYEKSLAFRELQALIGQPPVDVSIGLASPLTDNWNDVACRTTYFSSAVSDDGTVVVPLQARLEATTNGFHNHVGKSPSPLKRQSTRYSVHGLHDYRGKFNPQIVRAILNILGVSHDDRVLDPFCGSGTTLVECIHSGIRATGFDLNPFAVFLSNAKIKALGTEVEVLADQLQRITSNCNRLLDTYSGQVLKNARFEYLGRWFDAPTLFIIEYLKSVIELEARSNAPVFLALASDLLRDYSLQEPADLRIRRRKTPLPELPFIEAFYNKANEFLRLLESAQGVLGVQRTDNRAQLSDTRHLDSHEFGFDVGLTSPPYATALPYIDTQRLSLVWLELCTPKELSYLEANLTGSREFARGQKVDTRKIVIDNEYLLPEAIHTLCLELVNSLTNDDGFRRKAVPYLLYRYFRDMQSTFVNLKPIFKSQAPFALVVGHNHTVIGGQRFDIDTPQLLAQIAINCGWIHEESIPLQTYQRYDIHSSNAVKEETLLILRNT